MHGALARHLPHGCMRDMPRARTRERVSERRARCIVRAENLLAAGIGAADCTIDLPADGILLVQQHDGQPGTRRTRGRAHACGTGADHDDIDGFRRKTR
jgi:hypothetical protein